MNISPDLLKVLGQRDANFASYLTAAIGEEAAAKTIGVGDVHIASTGDSKRKLPVVDFNTALDGEAVVEPKGKSLAFDVEAEARQATLAKGVDFDSLIVPADVAKVLSRSSGLFSDALAAANGIDISKAERVLKPHKDGGAHTPFPYDAQALDKIPDAQKRRFLSALTSPDDLEQRDVPIKSLIAIQPRVSPDKVESIRTNGADKLPVVVRHDSKNYLADGNHRATASWLDGENTIACRYCRLSGEDASLAKEVEWELPFQIRKTDEDQQLIFGWASVVQKGDYLVIDKQGDMILPEELERAAYEYMLEARDHGDSHKILGTGKCVESIVFTKEKQAALGITIKDAASGEQIVGWWVGYKVGDDIWARHKSGELKEFSIGGKSASISVDDLMNL